MEKPAKSNNTKTILIALAIILIICTCTIVAGLVAFSGLIFTSSAGIEKVQQSANDTRTKSDLMDINLEVANYYSENGEYPVSLNSMGIKTTANGLPVYYQRVNESKYTLYVNLTSGERFDLSN